MVTAPCDPNSGTPISARGASARFGYGEVDGRLVRTWDGFLLWLSPSESDLVKRLLTADSINSSIPTATWLHPDFPEYQQRLADLPGLLARGVVSLRNDKAGQHITLRLASETPAVATRQKELVAASGPTIACDACHTLAERVTQADVIGALIRARGGEWLLRMDASVPACDHNVTGSPWPQRPAQARTPAIEAAGDPPRLQAYSTSWRGGSAESTRRDLWDLVDVDHGIIAGIRRGSGLPESIPVWFAGPNRALSTADPSGLTWRWPGNAMGKGLTDDEAQLSALAEAAERWSGTWQRSDGTEPVCGHDLVTGKDVLVSSEVVFMGHPPLAGTARHTDSNGLAAGVTLADAQLQALLEIIERDAIAAWWEGETGGQPVDLPGSVRDDLAPFLEWLEWLGLRVDLTRLPSLAGTHTRLAVGLLPSGNRWTYGAGTHLDEGIATRRAVLELVQSTVAALATPREVGPGRGIRLESFPKPETGPLAVKRSATDQPVAAPPAQVASAVAHVAQGLAAAGYHPLTVDVTRPEVGVPVARVIVEGLRGMPLPMR